MVQDWTQFKKRVSIKASKKTIFDHWTKQELLEKWFLSLAEFTTKDSQPRDRNSSIEAGDTYTWMWHGSDNVAKGQIIVNNQKGLLKFTFLTCEVILRMVKENGENIIDLTQSHIPTDDASKMNLFVECSRGWTFYMTNLKALLEGGLDLRNKDGINNVINT